MNEYDSWPSVSPQHLLLKQMQQQSFQIAAPNEFDPYQVLLKRKKQQDSGQMPPIKDINPDDLYELQEFCKTHGIMGFNMGTMNPKAALAMLKKKMGIKVETPISPSIQNKLLLG
jgi:hypothetical protein